MPRPLFFPSCSFALARLRRDGHQEFLNSERICMGLMNLPVLEPDLSLSFLHPKALADFFSTPCRRAAIHCKVSFEMN